MPFKLQPNPRLYKTLFEQWQKEEAFRHEQELASRAFFSSKWNLFLLYLFIILILLQVSLMNLRRWQETKRALRRQMYLQSERGLEDGKYDCDNWEVDLEKLLSEKEDL